MFWWDRSYLRTSQFVVVRRLKLSPPLLKFNVPADRPEPQASIEFELAHAESVQVAAEELVQKGFALLHDARAQPWGRPSPDSSHPRA